MSCVRDIPEVRVCHDHREAINRATEYYDLKRRAVKRCSLKNPPIFVQTGRHTVYFLPWHELEVWSRFKTYSIGGRLYYSGEEVRR